MVFTIKKLSRLAKVSVRTIHYYEEIGLLKPAYYGENGYRYYEEKQLKQLQQILFFKELGFTLKQIRQVIDRPKYVQLKALHSHKKRMKDELSRLERLVMVIDETLNPLKKK